MSKHGYRKGPKRASASVTVVAAVLTLAVGTASCSGSEPEAAERERTTTGPGAATSSTSPGAPIGTITTVVGNGLGASSGDGGPATEASVSAPGVVGVDAQGNLYITDADVRVRKIDPSGVISTVVGPSAGGQSAPGKAGELEGGYGTVDPQGNLYLWNRDKIVRVTPSGEVSTVAGTGQRGSSGDGGPATEARLWADYAGLAIDAEGNLYVTQSHANVVRKVDTDGIITTIAGTGKPGFSGDGGPAAKAQLNFPTAVGADGEGNIYISDSENHRVRRIDTDGIITTVAGNGKKGFPDDGAMATEVPIGGTVVRADTEGNIYITDEGYPGIFKVNPEGVLTVLAGTGEDGYSGDGGPATEAQLSAPTTVAIGPDGNLYIADWGNNRIRMVVLGP
jgi:trimeric autotransporter adhesin